VGQDIVVIGGSEGSLHALRTIVAGLPPTFPGSLFIVVHLSPEVPSMLDTLLSSAGRIPATQARDGEGIQPGHIYVAPSDHHLTLLDGHVGVQKGPRENRHRPAIDPLFRTAARIYGERVTGVLLSGRLDDGVAGLLAVRRRGGMAIVQAPADARAQDLPARALRYAGADYVLAAPDIAAKLIELAETKDEVSMREGKQQRIVSKKNPADDPESNLTVATPEESEGKPSVFACPECHGVLWELKNGRLVRFRCRVGHSFGPESLSLELSLAGEAALWAAMRALEEKAAMQRRLADPSPHSASGRRLREQSASDEENAKLIREMIFNGENGRQKKEKAKRLKLAG
jgi:two-component system chemotaxis response regulator CheB